MNGHEESSKITIHRAAHVSGSPQLSSVILIASDSAYTESSAVRRYARALVHLGRGSHYCGTFRVECAMLATRLSSGIDTDSLGGCQLPSADVRSRFIG
jgi:hypothetical protein